MPHPEINKWSCLPHPKSVTLNDFEQRNGHYVALFRRIDSLVKFSDGWTKCLSKFYDFGLGSILSYISDGGVSRPFGRLQRGCQKEIKGRRQNIKACWQTSRGLNNATTHCERETCSIEVFVTTRRLTSFCRMLFNSFRLNTISFILYSNGRSPV